MRRPSRLMYLLILTTLVVGVALNRGVLIGYKIEAAQLSRDYPLPFYKKHCRYLFFTGVQQVWTHAASTREETEASPCAALKPESIIHRHTKVRAG